jgi:predicted AAA+ superfamily ATPase
MRNKKNRQAGDIRERINNLIKITKKMTNGVEVTSYLDEEDLSSVNTSKHTQWSVLQNGEFAPSFVSVPNVPSGLYEMKWNSPLQTWVVAKQALNIDELYELPSPEIESILSDIKIFWRKRETYKEYNFVHKRGILLYGDPGCGKSGIIQLCVKSLIEEENGIVINIKEDEDFKAFIDFVPTIRTIEPDRPLIVILEDIDSLAGEDRYSTTKLLNILDGVKQIENVVYIATTNYPEKLQERITNRPSRFDRRYEVQMPSREIRESYLKNKLTEDDLKSINIEEWLDASEDMSLSHLKELVISVIVMGKDFKESLASLNSLADKPKIKGGKKKSSIGFSMEEKVKRPVAGFGRSSDAIEEQPS